MKRKIPFVLMLIFAFSFLGAYFVCDNSKTSDAGDAYAVSVNADTWDGVYPTSISDYDYKRDGDTNRYRIYTARGLAYFSHLVNDNNTQFSGCDIYLETNINLNLKEWTPIGNNSNSPFKGKFYGNGYKIYNPKLATTADSLTSGLFGYTGGGSITNLTLENVDLSLLANIETVGLLVGDATDTYIQGCTTNLRNEPIFGNNFQAETFGGVVGKFTISNRGELKQCGLEGKLLAKNVTQNFGGIVGRYVANGTAISQCYINGRFALDNSGIDASQTFENPLAVGGIVGRSEASQNVAFSLDNSYVNCDLNMTNLKTTSYVGAFAGHTQKVNIKNVYFNGRLNYTSCRNMTYCDSVGLIDPDTTVQGTTTKGTGYYTEREKQTRYRYKTDENGEYVLDEDGNKILESYEVWVYVQKPNPYSFVSKLNLGTITNFRYKYTDYGFNSGTNNGYYYTNKHRIARSGIYLYYGYDSTNSNTFNYTRELDEVYRVRPTSGDINKSPNYAYLAEYSLTSNSNVSQVLPSYKDFYEDSPSWDTWGASVWKSNPYNNNGLIYLRWTDNVRKANNEPYYSADDGQLKGEGTQTNPYLISTAGDLGYFATNYENVYSKKTNAYYVLTNDIDLSGKNWLPIGNEKTPFSGVFDGNNYTISGLTCTFQQAKKYQGLFGVTKNAVIKNITIEKSKFINATSDGTYGVFAGKVCENSYFVNCKSVYNYQYFDDEKDDSDPNKPKVPIFGCIDANANLDSNIYVVYGVKNCSQTYDLQKDNFINPEDEVLLGNSNVVASSVLHFGYDVKVYRNGGTFYKASEANDITWGDTTYRYAKFEYTNSNGETKKSSNPYYGKIDIDYHFMIEKVDAGWNYIQQSIDSTIGQNLPALSNRYGEKDILIKQGYILTGYKLADETNQVLLSSSNADHTFSLIDFDPFQNKIIAGLKPQWKYQRAKVKLYLNLLEKSWYKTELTKYAHDSIFKVDDRGEVYVEYDCEYDTFFNNLSFKNEFNKIRNGDSEIDDLYLMSYGYDSSGFATSIGSPEYDCSGYVFVNNLDADNPFLCKAEWRADSQNNDYKVDFNFELENFSDKFYSYDFFDSITRQDYLYYNSSNPTYSEKYLLLNDDGKSISTTYNTRFSDRRSRKIVYEIKLSPGYRLDMSGISTSPDAKELNDNGVFVTNYFDEGNGGDLNFGRPLISWKYSTIKTKEVDGRTYKSQNQYVYRFVFNNLVGDYLANLKVIRESQSIDTIINGDIAFGIGAKVTADKILIFDKEVGDFVEFNTAFGVDMDTKKLYVAYDYQNNRLVTSSNQFDSITLADKWFDDEGKLRLCYQTNVDGTLKNEYYVYKKIEAGTTDNLCSASSNPITLSGGVDLYLSDGAGTLDSSNFIASWARKADGTSHIHYYTSSSFTFLYSSENSDALFGKIYPNSRELNLSSDETKIYDSEVYNVTIQNTKTKVETDVSGAEVVSILKGAMYFDHIGQFFPKGLTSTSLPDPEAKIELLTKYTNASFQFQAVKKAVADGENEEVIYSNAAYSPMQAVSVLQSGGTFTFDIVATDYFRFMNFDGSNPIKIKSSDTDASWNLKFVVTNPTCSSEAEEKTYTDSFNLNNTNILSYYSSQYFKKGTAITGETFAQDTYRVTLEYSGELKPGGYLCSFVCEDVKYSVDYDTKFVDHDENLKYSNEEFNITESNFVDESAADSQITTTLLRNDETDALPNHSDDILFSDNIKFNTTIGQDKGFSFLCWAFDDGSGLQYLENSNEFERLFSILNAQDEKTGDDRFKIKFYAIYERKQANITFESQYFFVENQDETYEENYTNIQISLNKPSITYKYSTADTQSVDLSNLKFEKQLGDEYYFVGYKILLKGENGWEDALVTKDWQSDAPDEFSIYEFIKNKLSADETIEAGSSWKIVPILKRKLADVYFHSGTGTLANGETCLYNDGLNGTVYDETSNESTNRVFAVKDQIANSFLTLYSFLQWRELDASMNIDSFEDYSGSIEKVFNKRVGYYSPSKYYWGYHVYGEDGSVITGGTIDLSTISLDDTYFYRGSLTTKIHFYRIWTPSTYTIYFNAGKGYYQGDNAALEIDYDTDYNNTFIGEESLVETVKRVGANTYREGYKLVGWNYNETRIFDNDGNLKDDDVVFIGGRYKVVGNITLDAVWIEGDYDVEIVTNDADSAKLNGQDLTNTKFVIKYAQTFENLSQDGENFNISLDDFAFERKGYIFDGFYTLDGGVKTKVTTQTVFDRNLKGANLSSGVTLYVGWKFDESYLALDLNSTTFENKTFDKKISTYYLGSMFDSSNILNIENFINSSTQTQLSLSANVTKSTLGISISSTNVSVNSEQMSFVVKNAETYYVTLKLVIIDDAEFLNLGTVYEKIITFSVTCEKAVIDTEEIEKAFGDEAKLKNLQRLAENLVSKDSTLLSCETLTAFINEYKKLDSTIADATNDEAYNYIKTKYYLLYHTNGDEFKKYKDWTYQQFVDEKFAESEEYAQILKKSMFFDFYDSENEVTQKTLDNDTAKYNTLSLLSKHGSDVLSNVEDVTISAVRLFNYTNLTALSSPSVRIYFEDELKNYQTSFDENGAYIQVNAGYVYPQVLKIKNNSTRKSTYFNGQSDKFEIEWQANQAPVEIAGQNGQYYRIGQTKYFVSAKLYTSGAGQNDIDTDFSWTGDKNYLYFDEVRIFENNGDNYTEVTDLYRLALNEDDIFSILGVKGLVRLNLYSKYRTLLENSIEIGDVDRNMAQRSNLLKVSSVTYTDPDTNKSVTTTDTKALNVGSRFEVSNILMFEILSDSDNTLSIYANRLVTKMTFAIEDRFIGTNKYFGFNRWADNDSNSFEDGEVNPSYTNLSDVTDVTFDFTYDTTDETIAATTTAGHEYQSKVDSLFEIDYYAFFTDLVEAEYKLNFKGKEDRTDILKLGYSTQDNIYIPSQTGFSASSIKVVGLDYTTRLDYSEIFVGTDKVFRGLNIGFDASTATGQELLDGLKNYHQKVIFEMLWTMNDIEAEQYFTTYKTSAGSLEYFTYDSVANITNYNDEFFSYSYTWQKFDSGIWTTLSNGERLTFQSNGRYIDSGRYRLKIVAQVLSAYTSSIESGVTAKSLDLNFELQFMRYQVTEVSLPENRSADYDAKDHLTDFTVGASYKSYNRETDSYDTDLQISSQYSKVGNMIFSASSNGAAVEKAINVGTYNISFVFDEELFDVSNISTDDMKFDFEILPIDVDLSKYKSALDAFSKIFNETDPELSIIIYETQENIKINLSRQAGEDLGVYEIYFAGTSQEFKNNINYKFNDVMLFENGSLTAAASTTNIGKFEIKQSLELEIYYEESETANLQFNFNNFDYQYEITNNAQLVIKNNSITVKTISLKLYDKAQKKDVSGEQLNILKALLGSIVPNFAGGTNAVRTSGTYYYSPVASDELKNYYPTIKFRDGYSITIVANSVDDFVVEKVFDGNDMQYFDLDKNEILDIDSYSGVYICARYTSVHVGENIKVVLWLESKNTSEDLSNYQLAKTSTTGKITKLKANLNATLDKSSYTFTEVTKSNVDELLSFNLTSTDGNDVTSLLYTGYYSIDFDLKNANVDQFDYVYKGSYNFEATATFGDFEILSYNLPTLQIDQLSVEVTLGEGYVTTNAGQTIAASYERQITYDKFNLNLNLLAYDGDTALANTTAVEGKYKLVLAQDLFENDSLKIVLKDNQSSFVVLKMAGTLFARLDDQSVLTDNVYNKKAYKFVGDAENKTLKIYQDDTLLKQTTISFFTKNDEGVETIDNDVIFTTLNILTFDGLNQVTLAGNYLLKISTVSSKYANSAVFEIENNFVIDQKQIDVTKLDLTKSYDRRTDKNITQIDEVELGDSVAILVRFDSVNVGETNGKLLLQGTDLKNYALSQTTFTNGMINKADATLTLTSTKFVYGDFKSSADITFTITASSIVLPSEYTVSFDIENAQYSSANYLYAGTYNVLANIESDFYNVSYTTAQIEISKYVWNLNLTENGGMTLYYGDSDCFKNTFVQQLISTIGEHVDINFERENGSTIGFYRVTGGNIDGSTSQNYTFSVIDSSAYGYLQIKRANKGYYMLLSNEQTVSADDLQTGATAKLSYSGIAYDQVKLVSQNDQYYMRVSSLSYLQYFQDFALNLYYYNAETLLYELVTDEKVEGFGTNFSLVNKEIKNIGTYSVQTSNTTCENLNLRMGKQNATLYTFYIQIVPKQIYFKNSVVSKVFDNKDAIINYDDANTIFDGIYTKDTLSATITLKKGDAVARYVGSSLICEAKLIGDAAENYEIVYKSIDDSDVTGRIDRANIKVILNSSTYTYGEFTKDTKLKYEYQTDVDLTGYDNSSRNGLVIALNLNALDENYSTSNCLNAGVYSTRLAFGGEDFVLQSVIIDSKEYSLEDIDLTNLTCVVTVETKTLQIVQKSGGQSLSEIFTKTYDGETSANITDSDNNLLFDIVGIVGSDVVKVGSAYYAQATVGKSIKVNFDLLGADRANYVLDSLDYGTIKSIIVGLEFDYSKNGYNIISNVKRDSLQEISSLAFPFMTVSYLTSNSADANTISTRNFPTSLSGYTGHSFQYWIMTFDVQDGSTEKSQLESLIEKYSLQAQYNSLTEIYSVRVDNDEKTVRFLNALIGEENLLGYYYKQNNNIKIKFVPQWDENRYTLKVVIADWQTRKEITNGSFDVVIGSNTITNQTSWINNDMKFDSTVSIMFTAGDHTYYREFSSKAGKSLFGQEVGSRYILSAYKIDSDDTITIYVENQKVNVVLKIDDAQTKVENSQNTNFTKLANGNYTWTSDYFDFVNNNVTLKTIAQTISKTGFSLATLGGVTYDQFESTTIASLVRSASSKEETITLSMSFGAEMVEITLDYGYEFEEGVSTKTLQAQYSSAFNTAVGWQDDLQREGYEFGGWFSDEMRVYGTDLVLTTDAITLTAKWTVKKYSVSFVAENGQILDASQDFDYDDQTQTYTFSGVPYQTQLTFTLSANSGYEISDAASWSEYFTLLIGQDRTSASVTFTMPAIEDFKYSMLIEAKNNLITFAGEHIENVVANGTTLQVGDEFRLKTGNALTLKVTPSTGFKLSENVLISDENVEVLSKTIEDGILTIEVSNITKDVEFSFETIELINSITITFDDYQNFDRVVVDGRSYVDLTALENFSVQTGKVFEFYVKTRYGFVIKDAQSDEFTVTASASTEEGYEEFTKVSVSQIYVDGQVLISSERQKFVIKAEVVSYDENQNEIYEPANEALIKKQSSAGGIELVKVIEVEYETEVTIKYNNSSIFSFVGWSYDKTTVISRDKEFICKTEQDQTIYAIFSKLKYTITLSAADNFELTEEAGGVEKVEYRKVYTSFYRQDSNGNKVEMTSSSFDIYYGSEETIYVDIPNGYTYVGYGYMENGVYTQINSTPSSARQIKFTISSYSLDKSKTNLDICVVIRALYTSINFESFVDVNGVKLENEVGIMKLTNSNSDDANSYGYAVGSRVHYHSDSFANGEAKSNTDFRVVAFTGDEIFVKVKCERVGYAFKSITSTNKQLAIVEIRDDGEYKTFKITNFTGNGEDVDFATVTVLFKPKTNIVDLSFVDSNGKVNAGAFTVSPEDGSEGKVWTSGREYSGLTVSALSDSAFVVNAYIRVGYTIDLSNIQIVDESNIIDRSTITSTILSIKDKGYVAKISFKVSGYLGISNINVVVKPSTYKVLLKEQDKVLAQIDDVKFGSQLDLADVENITVLDDRLAIIGGKLKSVIPKQNFNFEGYFTHQNGGGVRYIDSNGDAINAWNESGYQLNKQTNKYELGEDVYIDESGEVVVSLYIYWSYLKTRISFEFEPSIVTNYTAQDMIEGVDWSNSWFYKTSPNYIEVSFNTNIKINAPKLDGYGFFKFVISQKNIDGIWLTDAVAYTDSIPWSTNDYDKIVECNIKLVYFAQIEVETFGGEGSFNIIQDYTEPQAKTMLEKGYADTSKTCSIEAVPADGYDFAYWIDLSTNVRYSTKILTNLTIKQKTSYMLTLGGKSSTLSFEQYNPQFGQITGIIVESMDNSYNEYTLGHYEWTHFMKDTNLVNVRVGDKITFVMKVDYGFAVSWDRKDIKFSEYLGDNTYYFTMKILPEDAGKTVEINPTFQDELLSIYVNAVFADGQVRDDAIDMNITSAAGEILCNGQKTNFFTMRHGVDATINPNVKDRYKVEKVTVKNYGRTFENVDGMFEDGVVKLKDKFLTDNLIIGNVEITIEFSRKMWEGVVSDHFAGEGTKNNPYLIRSEYDLAMMMKLVNSGAENADGVLYRRCYYLLQNDIVLAENFWTPIGTDENPFAGKFDFKDHKVSSIYLAYIYERISYYGLFGVVAKDAQITSTGPSLWYIYLIISIILVVVAILVFMIVYSKRRKKQREELSKI